MTAKDLAHVLIWLGLTFCAACALGGVYGLIDLAVRKLRHLRVRLQLQREYRQHRQIITNGCAAPTVARHRRRTEGTVSDHGRVLNIYRIINDSHGDLDLNAAVTARALSTTAHAEDEEAEAILMAPTSTATAPAEPQRKDLRSDHQLLVTTVQPYCHVEERIGSSDFVRCTADLFEHDTLTITALDDERVMRVYRPGLWRECAVFGPHGQLLFAFISGTPVEPFVLM